KLNDAIAFAQTRKPAAVEDLNFDLGWALSKVGAQQARLAKFRESIENFETARLLLTKTLKVNEATLKLDEKALLADESDETQASDERQARKADKDRQSKLLTLFE